MLRFDLLFQDSSTQARIGRLHTPHGVMDTPAFMPVGTAGTVKAMLPEEVAATGAQTILGNTFHLWLRPGHELIQHLGGLHKFQNWPHSILTDSGGFQVFSLAKSRKITEEGVSFQSPYDGAACFLTPELSIAVQEALGTDIAMAFDECPDAEADKSTIQASIERTTRWLDRCISARKRPEQTALFGIVQGGVHDELRLQHAEVVKARPLDGYAIGGVAVGESKAEIARITALTTAQLPVDRPRYLMGVGEPDDLVRAVALGVDMFDCVMPTRNARHGRLLSSKGIVHIKQAINRTYEGPIDEACACPTCRNYSRAYLRHLWVNGEILAHRLHTMHNLWFMQRHMEKIREAIRAGTLKTWCDSLPDLVSG